MSQSHLPNNAHSARSRTRLVQFCFGEVRHARLNPIHHAFRYRAFFVRIGMHELSGRRSGNWLFGVNRPALLSINEMDHGKRKGSSDWVASLLTQTGLPAPAELWLHAFPRVLGYVFKPVSFWFCHNEHGALYAILAEVHNTFGEQHCYLLSKPDALPLKAGESLSAQKAFHVSPFCDVGGHYRFRFMNTDERSCARIDYDDANGPLLTTSLSGRFEPLSNRTIVKALLGYPLFSVGVITRIHWQALRLWLGKLPIYRKPPAPQEFVTRGPA